MIRIPGYAAIAARKPESRCCGRRRTRQAAELDDVALAVEDRVGEYAGGCSDGDVVGADEGGVAVALDLPVDDDDRNAGLEDPLDHRGERLGLVGRDDQQVDLLLQEVLDVGYLLGVVLLSIGHDDVQVGIGLGRRIDVGIHRHPPRLGVVGLREADQELALVPVRAAAGERQESGRQQRRATTDGAAAARPPPG